MKQNLIMLKERSGKYINAIRSSNIFSLYNMTENGKLKAGTIKMMLRTIWPVHKYITGRDVLYIRAKVMMLMPVLRANPQYEQFK